MADNSKIQSVMSLYDLCKTSILHKHQNRRELEKLENYIPHVLYSDIIISHLKKCSSALICFFSQNNLKICRYCFSKRPGYSFDTMIHLHESFQCDASKTVGDKYRCAECGADCIEQSDFGCEC